jgi:hypothetical protein
MSKRMSDVRRYLALEATYSAEDDRRPNEESRERDKNSYEAGMYKEMNGLTRYVACRDRDNWDFRENSASNGKIRMVSQLPGGPEF